MNADHSHSPKPCALCGAKRKLEVSHIIPQFVYRWQNETATDDEGRGGPAIDRGTQGGIKRPMLCGQCEDLFSLYESDFARLIFHPVVARGTVSTKYDGWLRKFAASVCWRIIEDMFLKNRLIDFPEQWIPALGSCRNTWRHYLSGKRPDVGGHHVHLLQWDDLMGEDGAGFLGSSVCTAPAARRSRERSIQMKVHSGKNEAFVYAKLGPFILFGLINDSHPNQWKGTRINAEGKLKPRDIVIPSLYRDYIFARFE